MMALVDVRFRFSDETPEILRGVSLRVEQGEIVGLVGAAGAGKSSVVKILCGLRPPESGSVFLGDRDLAHLAPAALRRAQSGFGVAFQNLALFDRLTIEDNVALPLLRRGMPNADALNAARKQLTAVGLAEAYTKLPRALSGGMRRRAALARALIGDPPACLFDDPFTGLDPVACARIGRLIATTRARGAATLVASSDPTALTPICDRMLLLENGTIVFDGPPAAFTARPLSIAG